MNRKAKEHYPNKIARKYLIYVFSYLDIVHKDMIKLLKPYIDNFDVYRLDAVDPFESLLLDMTDLILKAFGNVEFKTGITEFGSQISIFNDKLYDDKVYSLIGFNDIPYFRKGKLLEIWTKKNIELIKGIETDNVKKLSNLLYDSVGDGTSSKEIYDKVKEIFGYDDARAKLIVDDQIGKLNASLDRLKNNQAGVKEFTWTTVGDSSVRPKHKDFNGKVYTWKKGANGIYPGQEVRCRCFAEPVLDDIFKNLEEVA